VSKARHSALWNRTLHAVATSAEALVSHNIRIGDRRTSFRLDGLTWGALHDIAQRERVTVHALCTAVDSRKPRALSLTVAVRVAVLQYYRDVATDPGHCIVRYNSAITD
jgi:predicted DNA-binding ribbon-helix-helix protein